MERLDKVLANSGYGSRKDVKKIIKGGKVEIDGKVVKDSNYQLDPIKSAIKVSGEEIIYKKYIYLMMNKPDGVISATFDDYDKTVIDILEDNHKVFEPFPVGRLDKDTVGLLLLTNDGELNHRLISPKWHVDKIYYAKINSNIDKDDVEEFKDGIILDDGYKCMPAKLEILEAGENESKVKVTIQEGKYHQVKRMFESLGKKVIYLKRLSFGGLDLDKNLGEGEYRELTASELERLRGLCKIC
ncbi:pseudouridine synthase [Clostridium neuense]|uniref:Pseudouridine synthase n=1 Tax=Clostridium neuense TaxID=1728934 RepID=A0ABW8TKH1_9CLOT